MKEPTIREVIKKITDPLELDGVAEQLKHEDRLTPELRNLIAVHRAALVLS